MPRPPKRRETVIMSISIERELVLALKKAAREQGVSVSSLVERILLDALGKEVGTSQVPADPPSSDPVDPLEQLEAEEFFSELEKFEREVEELEKVVKAVASRGGGPALKPHLDHFRRQAWRKIERWHSLRRLYARCRNALPPQKRVEGATRLVKTKRTLNALLELLR